MAGNKAGAIKAKETMLREYGLTEDGKSAAHVRAGAAGGRAGRGPGYGGGFSAGEAGRERARIYGAIGGRISRRKKSV